MAFTVQIVPSALQELQALKRFFRANNMTSVTVDEFRLHPDRYLSATASGDVIVTQDGEPWIVLRAVLDDQDRLSAAYANSPEFWQLIADRRREQSIPWEVAKQQLDLGP